MNCKKCGETLIEEWIETGEFGKDIQIWLCPNCDYPKYPGSFEE